MLVVSDNLWIMSWGECWPLMYFLFTTQTNEIWATQNKGIFWQFKGTPYGWFSLEAKQNQPPILHHLSSGDWKGSLTPKETENWPELVTLIMLLYPAIHKCYMNSLKLLFCIEYFRHLLNWMLDKMFCVNVETTQTCILWWCCYITRGEGDIP